MNIEEVGTHQVIIDFGDLFTKEVTNLFYKEGEWGTATVQAKLVKKRDEIDLTDCQVVIVIINEAGEPVVDYADIIDPTRGIIEMKLPQIALTTGISFFELTIVDNKYRTKKSPKVAYRVLDSLTEDVIMQSERYPFLVDLIKQVDDLNLATNLLSDKTFELNADVRRLDQEVRQLNEDMLSAEKIRNDNEEVRKSNEIERQTNETERIANMEQFRKDFETFKTDMNTAFSNFTTSTNNTITEFKELVNTKITAIEDNVETFKTTTNEAIETFKTETNTKISKLPKIDNLTPNDVDTYSSKKIVEELAKKSEFNGSYINLTDKPTSYLASTVLHTDGVSSEEKITSLEALVENLLERVEALETPTE